MNMVHFIPIFIPLYTYNLSTQHSFSVSLNGIIIAGEIRYRPSYQALWITILKYLLYSKPPGITLCPLKAMVCVCEQGKYALASLF